jgi:putative PEP-CTERM system TPR-repeat lipoprotein
MHLKSVHSALLLAMLAAPVLSGCNPDSNLTAQERVQRAKDFESKGDLKASVIELKNALQKSPDDAQARWLLGLIYLKQNQGSDAETQLNRAVQLGISPESVRIPLARAWLLKDDYNQVLEKLQLTGKETPKIQAQIFEMRGNALMGLGKQTESCALFDQAISADATYALAYLGRSKCEYATGKPALALATAEKASALDPSLIEAFYLLGDLYRALKQPQQALAAYGKALKINPDDYTALVYRAMTLLSTNQTDAAAKDIAQIVKARPSAIMSLYLQAYVSYAKGKYNEATDYLQQILRADPNNLQALLLFGTVNYATQQNEIALNSFNKALTIADQPETRVLLAATQQRMGADEDALKTLTPVLAQGNNPKALLLAAQIVLNQGDYTKGLAYLSQASKLAPGDTVIRTTLATNQLLSGNQQGVSGLESIIIENPQATQAYLLLASAQASKGNFTGALATLQKMAVAQPKNALTYLLIGRIYLLQQNPAAARQAFERGLGIDAQFLPLAGALADLDITEKQPAKARDRFKTMLAKSPNNLGAMLGLTRVDMAFGDQNSYVADLKNTIQKLPNATEPVTLLTQYYIQQARQPQLALEVAQKAARSHPDNPVFLSNLGQAQLAAGRKQEAITTYTSITNLQPNAPGSWYQLAWAQRATGDLTAALASLQKALVIAPNYLDAHIALAGIYIAKNQNDAAIKEIRAIQTSNPQSAIGYNLEAELYARLKKPDLTLQTLDKALKNAPSRETAATYHRALIRAGQTVQAEQVAQDWLKVHADDVQFRQYLANDYINRQQSAQAIAQYRQILQIAPTNISALNNLAALLQLKNDPTASQYAKQAYALQPQSPIVADTYGWSLIQQGQAAAALAPLNFAASALPQLPSVQYHLAVALAKTGETAKAETLLQKIISADRAFNERDDAIALQKQISGVR